MEPSEVGEISSNEDSRLRRSGSRMFHLRSQVQTVFLEKQGVIMCDKAADGLRRTRGEKWPLDLVSER